MSIEDRIGDWNRSLPEVYTPVRQDPDDIPLDGLSDQMRRIVLNARERKAARIAAEHLQQLGILQDTMAIVCPLADNAEHSFVGGSVVPQQASQPGEQGADQRAGACGGLCFCRRGLNTRGLWHAAVNLSRCQRLQRLALPRQSRSRCRRGRQGR